MQVALKSPPKTHTDTHEHTHTHSFIKWITSFAGVKSILTQLKQSWDSALTCWLWPNVTSTTPPWNCTSGCPETTCWCTSASSSSAAVTTGPETTFSFTLIAQTRVFHTTRVGSGDVPHCCGNLGRRGKQDDSWRKRRRTSPLKLCLLVLVM